MTTLRQAAEQALEAMESEAGFYLEDKNERNEVLLGAITAIREALAEQPAQREWVGLTDEEIDVLVMDSDGLPKSHLEFARAIEAKLREKNT